MEKFLSFGFDTERPYGSWADTEQGRQLRARQLAFVRKLNQAYDAESVPRTFFVLGQYLERCLDTNSSDELISIFDPENPMVEVGQHSYSHPVFREVKGAGAREVITPEAFAADLEKAKKTIEEILGVTPAGLRTPVGYHHDLSDLPKLALAVQTAGINYVSSDLKSEYTLEAEVTRDRQPHSYASVGVKKLMELPSHGWQDVVFTPEGAKRFREQDSPDTPEQIVSHYLGLLDQAETLDLPAVSVALCLHPWAVMEYDPDLTIHRQLFKGAREKGFEFVSYGELASISRFSGRQTLSGLKLDNY